MLLILFKRMVYTILMMALFGCSTRMVGRRQFVKHKQVEDNLLGPFSYEKMYSPTEIGVSQKSEGKIKQFRLQMRGTKNTADALFDESIRKKMHKEFVYTKGLYVIKNTAVYPTEGIIRGVVLEGWQDTASHYLDTGETGNSVILYLVLQSHGLSLGQILVDGSDMGFGWDEDFKYFQKEAKKELCGYWAKTSLWDAESSIGSEKTTVD